MVQLKPAPRFQWSQDFAVGVEEIDREHRQLFALAESMHQAMLGGKGKEILHSLLADLVDYTFYHFSHEEGLMKRTECPNARQHAQQHEGLRTKVRGLQARSNSGEVTMTIEVAEFLIEWLKQHTVASDRQIREHLKAMQADRKSVV